MCKAGGVYGGCWCKMVVICAVQQHMSVTLAYFSSSTSFLATITLLMAFSSSIRT